MMTTYSPEVEPSMQKSMSESASVCGVRELVVVIDKPIARRLGVNTNDVECRTADVA